MRTKTSKWFGLYQREKLVTISKNLLYIEIEVIVKLFGVKVKEDTRSVYLPRMDEIEPENLKVIAEAYTELISVAKELNN